MDIIRCITSCIRRFFDYLVRESNPVNPNEYLLRRVPIINNGGYVDLKLEQPVSEHAFMPRPITDVKGISINREFFIKANELAQLVKTKNNKDCYIIRFKTEDILTLSPALSAIPHPLICWPGHALIPEINRVLYESNKSNKLACKDMQRKLAKLIKKEDIVYIPEQNR